MQHRHKYFYQLILSGYVVSVFFLFGCKKAIEVEGPITSVNELNVYATDGTAISVLTGIYASMNNGNSFTTFTGNASMSLFSGLSSDELTLYSGVSAANYSAYYLNDLRVISPIETYGAEAWSPLYNYIYDCNAAMEGLNASTTLTPAIKQQLLGEATFLRSFFLFYLVNMYGDVPMPLTTAQKANSVIGRTSAALVYQQVIADLQTAKTLLSPNFLDETLLNSTTERVRPTKWAAGTLLARAYLYTKDYPQAESECDSVIGNSTLFSLDSLNGVFLENSTEAVWQLQPVIYGHNTEDAITYIIPSSGPSDVNGSTGNPVYLSPSLLQSFEPRDLRMADWVDSVSANGITYYFPFKYKVANFGAPVTEYFMVMRLAELFLIRAEARSQQGNIAGAQSDLNEIRVRAGLPSTLASSQASLLIAILHERQVELFTEWENRWFDLKRLNLVDSVMTTVCPQKGSSWNSYQQLYPILESDIISDHSLTQNQGY